MEVPGASVSSKPGETSVKWQLCYDMTAKMWWMVSGEVPTGTRVGAQETILEAGGGSGQQGASQMCGHLSIGAGVVGSGGDPALGI